MAANPARDYARLVQYPTKQLHPGMGQAVAERTVLRRTHDGNFETWFDVAHRVAQGNASLRPSTFVEEYELLRRHLSKAVCVMSGRHLQHGDETQPDRNQEIFTNCATAPASFLSFLLLLNGSGVGRCYDDDMMLVNWDDAPSVRCVINEAHPDYDDSAHESARDARHKYGGGRDVLWFEVPDSREGWAKALEMWEVAAFERVHKDKLLILDFSGVREKGRPIAGMQGRPSSGPVAVMNAFAKAMTVRGAGLPRWLQATYIDHYFAECVLVGGARRAARKQDKHWRDDTILDFIRVKRPIEYDGLSMDGVVSYRHELLHAGEPAPRAFLWSSNNSVAVDAAFWAEADVPGTWANTVFEAMVECAYADGTGEPGFTNVDQLGQNDEGWDDLYLGDYVGSDKFMPEDNTRVYLSKLARRAKKKALHTITNPCGEVALNALGGYCVIGSVAPSHADDLNEIEEALLVTTRALIRTNTMDSIYHKEVKRTNRIGVGLTGIHEFAWKFFRVGFADLIKPNMGYFDVAGLGDNPIAGARSMAFWYTLARFSRAVRDEAVRYSAELGMTTPHTCTMIAPTGTISKLFGLTEGAHLPAMACYLRWVQFRDDDPLIKKYADMGYPSRVLKQYAGHTIVGFPTKLAIADVGMGDELVLAGDATMHDQFRWVQLLERFWIEGDEPGHYGNQISYTLKYRPEQVGFKEFRSVILEYQPLVRTCSVMPQIDDAAYEYQPEQRIDQARYDEMMLRIKDATAEPPVSLEDVDCQSGACPVTFAAPGEAHLDIGAG